MLKELVKSAASLTANVAGALLHEVAEKLPVVDQVARKVGLRCPAAAEGQPGGETAASSAPRAAAVEQVKAAKTPEAADPPMPHGVSPTVAEALSHSEGPTKVKAKRGQKHGHH